jgi:hypothetical protein
MNRTNETGAIYAYVSTSAVTIIRYRDLSESSESLNEVLGLYVPVANAAFQPVSQRSVCPFFTVSRCFHGIVSSIAKLMLYKRIPLHFLKNRSIIVS